MYMGLDGVEVARAHKAWQLTRTPERKDTHRQYYVAEHGLLLSIGRARDRVQLHISSVWSFSWDVERRLSL
jgi:hypothetical protein